jgi:membrane protease YdiL (CAAX protease family)
MKSFDSTPNDKIYRFGIIYTLIFTLIAAVTNYFTWHVQFSTVTISILATILFFTMWFALYMPMPIFIKKAKWEFKDFGFVLNKRTIIISVAIALLILFKLGLTFQLSYIPDALIEGFARVGEEVFYRGFLYTLVLKLFKGKERPNFWAVVISSFVFAIMHTQTFLPTNPLTMQGIFINTLLLGFFRYFTGSILPGVIFHCASNAGVLAMLSGTLIYCLFIIFDYLRTRKKIQRIKETEGEVLSNTN